MTVLTASELKPYLDASARLHHDRLCPRQVLGVRMALYAGELLGLDLPRADKRLFVFVEIDGCFTDGIGETTGCRMGGRTMRLVEYGKIAATFVDAETGRAVRLSPSHEARARAARYAPNAESRWHTQLEGYQLMPAEELFDVLWTTVDYVPKQLEHGESARSECDNCHEEVTNNLHVQVGDRSLCRACANGAYYQLPS